MQNAHSKNYPPQSTSLFFPKIVKLTSTKLTHPKHNMLLNTYNKAHTHSIINSHLVELTFERRFTTPPPSRAPLLIIGVNFIEIKQNFKHGQFKTLNVKVTIQKGIMQMQYLCCLCF